MSKNMKYITQLISFLLLVSCSKKNGVTNKPTNKRADFIISFGSCNKQYSSNIFWDDIVNLKPDVWIWGGDNVYADTDNMIKLRADYNAQKRQKGYDAVVNTIDVIGTWDDHDYGLNDGGLEFHKKKESQQKFLDFLDVSTNSSRRTQEGVQHSKMYTTPKGSVKVIILDTRYFRTSLTKGVNGKRYQPNKYGEGTILGQQQWSWLEQELKNSNANFTVIVSSIQVISNKHGFEKWANFPHEREKLFNLIANSNATNVILLSGDRHISEFSKINVKALDYPIIDFTSSGLTHAYTNFSGEENPYRIGKVIHNISFGTLEFNFENKEVDFKMRGNNSVILQKITQTYN